MVFSDNDVSEAMKLAEAQGCSSLNSIGGLVVTLQFVNGLVVNLGSDWQVVCSEKEELQVYIFLREYF